MKKFVVLLVAVLMSFIDMPRSSVERVDNSLRTVVVTEAMAVPPITFTQPNTVHHHVLIYKLLLHIVPEAYKSRVRDGRILIIGSGLENSLLGDDLIRSGKKVAGLSNILNVIDSWWAVGHYSLIPFGDVTFAIAAGLTLVENLKERWHPNRQDRLVYWNIVISEISRILWKGGFFMVDAEEGEEFDIILRHNGFVRLAYAAFDGRAIYQKVKLPELHNESLKSIRNPNPRRHILNSIMLAAA
jgi:hypothetical protein